MLYLAFYMILFYTMKIVGGSKQLRASEYFGALLTFYGHISWGTSLSWGPHGPSDRIKGCRSLP